MYLARLLYFIGRMRPTSMTHLETLTELREFFPSRSQLARALGVKRDTLIAWEGGKTVRLRAKSEERLVVLRELCSEAATRVPERAAVGRWMLTEQPALRGATPAGLVRNYGADAFEAICHAIVPVSPRLGPQPTPSDQELATMDAELPGPAAERVRTARERLRDFQAQGRAVPRALF